MQHSWWIRTEGRRRSDSQEDVKKRAVVVESSDLKSSVDVVVGGLGVK